MSGISNKIPAVGWNEGAMSYCLLDILLDLSWQQDEEDQLSFQMQKKSYQTA